MKSLLTSFLLATALLLASCASSPDVPSIPDGYKVETFDKRGILEETHYIDDYSYEPITPTIEFTADDGRRIKSHDFRVSDRK